MIDKLNGGPWWVSLIVKMGATAVIAVGLVWFLTQEVMRRMDVIQGVVETSARQQDAHASTALAHDQTTYGLRLTLERILRVLEVTCVNTARDERSRRECLLP